ncbi:MAG TPA: hypothetical protein VF989_15405 [Polyangiaceae bacterium]
MESPGVASEDDDLWHVEVEPGEVRVMTLEQLDDLFRLDIVPSSARVWQPGMDGWLPLSVVAGIDGDSAEEIDEVIEIEPDEPLSALPPPSSRAPGGASPLSTTLPYSGAPSPYAGSSSLSPPNALLSSAPPPPAPYTASSPPFSGADALSSWPPPATIPSGPAGSVRPGSEAPAPYASPTIPAPFAPSYAPDPMPLPSFAPTATSTHSLGAGPGSSRFGTALLVFAGLFGLGVTLYRNDWLLELARSAGQEGAYTELESAIGSPGFGTPRAVAALNPIAESLSSPAPRAETAPSSDEGASSDDEDESAASSATQSARASQNAAARKPQKRVAPSPRRPSQAAPRKSSNIGIKGSSNKYDPLNPEL